VQVEAKATLEVGLAYGFSTLFILAAQRQLGYGHHTAIDPNQEIWGGVGVTNAKEFTSNFKFYNDISVHVIPNLRAIHCRYDVIFVDGNHRFDDVLVDFTLVEDICNMGGYIVLDDALLPSVGRVVDFIRANRTAEFEYLPSVDNLAVFKRIGRDQRPWNHFIPF
jgi:predicted O-methyltransferase YrrM